MRGWVNSKRAKQGHFLASVDNDHEGLKAAVAEVLPTALWQRCYVHFLRNALDYLPRKQTDDCLTELRWLYDRRDTAEARRDLTVWLARWQDKHPKLCAWVEANIDETFAFYRLPREHHKHLKSTNMLERLNQEIKRRTRVVGIFPNDAAITRLVGAVLLEQDEHWQLEGRRMFSAESMASIPELGDIPALQALSA